MSLRTRVLATGSQEFAAINAELADLALGGSAAGGEGRHLAFLPLDSLELDLEDPLQCELGDYCLLERLGQGGMGVVYRARQLSLQREVAVKLLAAGPWASREFIERFRREAQSAARMQHPNIVAIYEVGSQDEMNFFSMQLVRGESLAAVGAREGRIDPVRSARWVRTIAEAVDYAHRLDVLHLDLKPANVLVDDRGEPLVADFGLARRLGESLANEREVSGTPSYMAPEQAQPGSHRLVPATDVYGLGAILYELLTGAPPFLGGTPHATLRQVVAGELVPVRQRAPGVPVDLEAICARCLARDPGKRYASARALAEDLGAFLDGRATSVRPLGLPERLRRYARRQPLQAGLAALLLCTLVGGFAATSLQWQRAEHNAAAARTLLWDSRRQEAIRLAGEGRGFEAATLLLQNVEDSEGGGREDAASGDRRRLGLLLGQGLQLIDAIKVADAAPTALALSDDGELLAAGFDDLTVRWYDTASLREHGRVSLHGLPASEDMGSFQRVPFLLRFAGPHHLRVSLEWYQHWIRPGERDSMLVDLQRGALVRPPDGFRDASISADGGHALLHDGATAQLWQTLPWKPQGPRFDVVAPPMPSILTRGGRLALLLAPNMASFRLLDPRDPERPLRVDLPADTGLSAWAESSDGRHLAIGDHAGRLHLLSVPDGAVRSLPHVLREEIGWISFSEDDRWLAAGSGGAGAGGAVMVFDVETGAALLPDSLLHDFPVEQLRLIRAEQLLMASGGGQTALWRLPLPGTLAHRPHRLPTSPPSADAAPHTVALAAPSGLLATASSGGDIRLWRVPRTPLVEARGAALVPEQPVSLGRRMVEVSWNRVRIVGLDHDRASHWVELPNPPSFAELVDGDRTLLLVAGPWLHRLDATTLEPVAEPLALPASPQRLLLEPSGRWIVLTTGGSQSGVGFAERLWLLHGGQLRDSGVTLRGPLSLRASKDGERLLAVGPRDGDSVLFAMPTLQEMARYRHDPDTPVANAAFAADQRTVLLVERSTDPVIGDDALLLWQPGSAAQPLRRAIPGVLPIGVTAVEGGAFVSGSWRDLLVVPGQGPQAVTRLSRAQAVAPIALSPDGHWLARAQRYRDVELLDPHSGTALAAPLYWNPGGIQLLAQLAFAADGSALLARSSQGRWLRWPIAAEARSVAALREHLSLLRVDAHGGTLVPDAEARARLRANDPGPWRRLAPPPEVPALRVVDGEPVPPRPGAATPLMLDLTAAYTLAPTGNWGPRDHVIASLFPVPWGVQRLGGVDYDIRGAAGLNAPSGPGDPDGGPAAIRGIAVPPEPIAAFHVLLLAANRSVEDQAREYARLRLHYQDGSQAVIPMLTGRDVPGYAGRDGEVPQAWEYGMHMRILGEPVFLPVNNPRLGNPHPERIVRTLDIESGSGTWNAPVIFAVTAEGLASGAVIADASCCIRALESRPPAAGPDGPAGRISENEP